MNKVWLVYYENALLRVFCDYDSALSYFRVKARLFGESKVRIDEERCYGNPDL